MQKSKNESANSDENIVKKMRKRYNASAEMVADAIGVDVSSYYRYENGSAVLNVDDAYRCFRAIGSPNGWMMWMAENFPESFGKIHPCADYDVDDMVELILRKKYETIDDLIVSLVSLREWIRCLQ